MFGSAFLLLSGWFLTVTLMAERNPTIGYADALLVPAHIDAVEPQQKSFRDKKSPGGMKTVYASRIAYSYTVNGKKYTTSAYGFDTGNYYVDKADADATLAQYKVGQTVNAYVNAADPKAAMLSRSLNIGAYFCVLFLSTVLLFGAEVFVVGLVGLSAGQKANLVQEFIFDLPCFAWLAIMIQQLTQYFTMSSAPHPASAYVLVAIATVLAVIFLYMRLGVRGLVPTFRDS